jgi:hypothetical protein
MIKFRPHHFLCTLCFKGKGYSNAFVKNYQRLVSMLKTDAGDDAAIQVVFEADIICSPCPHKRGTGCQTQDKINLLDQKHAEALGLNENEIITWGEAKRRIQEKISLEKFNQICAACEWKKYGICESVLKNFIGASNR